MSRRIPRILAGVPWITESGEFDPSKYPIDSVLRQTLSPSADVFRSGCALLQSMIGHGRTEAGVYLLGLLRHYERDLVRLTVVVESLCVFRTAESASALFHELVRIKSSNTTRRYLDCVIAALTHFPYDMVKDGFAALFTDPSFSPRMQAKFEEALYQCPMENPTRSA